MRDAHERKYEGRLLRAERGREGREVEPPPGRRTALPIATEGDPRREAEDGEETVVAARDPGDGGHQRGMHGQSARRRDGHTPGEAKGPQDLVDQCGCEAMKQHVREVERPESRGAETRVDRVGG